MKPNFALNLSHEGISLLHRAKTGWSRVGDVALDDPDLNDHLSLMRKTAADLDSGGLTSKLVIPNSQILYTEVDAPGPGEDERVAQIREGLAGLTPYDVKDLVFDWRLKGKRAQVAVVAQETLKEAEAFAAEFRFNPVSFVAVPQNGGFDGEPFFGPTAHAAKLLSDDDSIEPDTEMMRVLRTERPPAAQKPKAASEPAPSAPVSDANAADTPVQGAAPESPASPPTETAKPRTKTKAAQPKSDKSTDPELAPLPVTFSSRRAAPAPTRTVPPRLDPVAAKPAAASEPKVQFTHQTSALDIDDVPDMPAWRTVNGRDVTPMPVTAAHVADPLPSESPAQATAEPRPAKAAAVAGAALAGTMGTLGKLGQGTAASVKRMRERKIAVEASETEAKTMTVFGARDQARVGGKPRFLGLILTGLLLVAFGILALWVTYFPGTESTDLPDRTPEPAIAAIDPDQPLITESTAEVGSTSPEVTTATAEPGQPATPISPERSDSIDSAVESALLGTPEPDPNLPDDTGNIDLALLTDPTLPSPEDRPPPDQIIQPPPTQAEAEASYAATGIWQLDPEPLPGQTGGDRLEDLYIASIDPRIQSQDAVALPASRGLTNDLRPSALTPPPLLGTAYDLDDRGLVRATPEGALSPDGVRIFAGTPPVVPRLRPGTEITPTPASLPTGPTAEPTTEPVTEAPDPETAAREAERERLQQIRPRIRPDTLQETNERSRLGGFSRSELALIRPTVRPQSVQEEVAEDTAAPESETPTTDDESATDLAVVASLSPTLRPSDFSATVKKALEEAVKNPPAPATNPAPAPNVAAAVVPSIPSRSSVAKQATERNAIKLGKVNLIGVYGSPSDRRALVRLKSGRYIKVEVGDRVDGGRVAAIGDDELRYVKGGRNITLKMPKG